MKRKLQEWCTKILFTKHEWKQYVLEEAKLITKNEKRCCLIICQTTSEVAEFYAYLESSGNYEQNKIMAYFDSESTEQEQKL